MFPPLLGERAGVRAGVPSSLKVRKRPGIGNG
jgi:hypothetical protein